MLYWDMQIGWTPLGGTAWEARYEQGNKKSIGTGLCAALLIALAMWTRWASRTDFHDHGWNYLRSGIYVFLFGAWGLSIRFRIVQTHVRRYLLMIAALMMLWLLLRSVKFSIDNVDAERLLWYCYYVPMLFIPMLSMFVSLSLGKPEDFRLPRWTKLLYLPTTLLLLLVLTNDLHQCVFSFPSGVMSDQDYRYKSGYFLVVMWELFCAVVSITMILLPHSAQQTFSLAAARSACHVGGLRRRVCARDALGLGDRGDMTVTLCLILPAFLKAASNAGSFSPISAMTSCLRRRACRSDHGQGALPAVCLRRDAAAAAAERAAEHASGQRPSQRRYAL